MVILDNMYGIRYYNLASDGYQLFPFWTSRLGNETILVHHLTHNMYIRIKRKKYHYTLSIIVWKKIKYFLHFGIKIINY